MPNFVQNKSLSSNKLTIDVMTNNGETFYKTLKYQYNPLFKFDRIAYDNMMLWLLERVPSLRTRKDAVLYLTFPDGEEQVCQFRPNETATKQ